MKLFGRSGGYYLFWTGAVWFTLGVTLSLTDIADPQFATLMWLIVLSLPLLCPPVARHFNMEPVMFDFFKSRKEREAEYNNVIKFPEPVAVPVVPEVKKEEPTEKFDSSEATYTVGRNKSGNTQLRMKLEHGSASLTMAPDAVVELIEQLALTIRKQYSVEIFDLTVEETANEAE